MKPHILSPVTPARHQPRPGRMILWWRILTSREVLNPLLQLAFIIGGIIAINLFA